MAVDNETIKREIIIGFEYSYLHDDWVNPLSEALEGVTAKEAIWRPGPDAKGIWDMVLHMATWNENIVERIETGETVGALDGHWPAPPVVPDEAAWEAAKKRLWNSLDSIQRTLESSSLEKIQSGGYHLGDLLCRFTHMGYHLGQITKLRECMPFMKIAL